MRSLRRLLLRSWPRAVLSELAQLARAAVIAGVTVALAAPFVLSEKQWPLIHELQSSYSQQQDEYAGVQQLLKSNTSRMQARERLAYAVTSTLTRDSRNARARALDSLTVEARGDSLAAAAGAGATQTANAAARSLLTINAVRLGSQALWLKSTAACVQRRRACPRADSLTALLERVRSAARAESTSRSFFDRAVSNTADASRGVTTQLTQVDRNTTLVVVLALVASAVFLVMLVRVSWDE